MNQKLTESFLALEKPLKEFSKAVLEALTPLINVLEATSQKRAKQEELELYKEDLKRRGTKNGLSK